MESYFNKWHKRRALVTSGSAKVYLHGDKPFKYQDKKICDISVRQSMT